MAENAPKEKNGKKDMQTAKSAEPKKEAPQAPAQQPQSMAKQAPPPTPEMQHMQAKYNDQIKKVNLMVTKIAFYPIDITYKELMQLRAELIDMYKKGDVFIKNIIIVEINERMSHIEQAKEFVSAAKMAEKLNKQVDIRELTTRIYDSAHSLDGIMLFIGVLAEMDDERAMRLLAHHLTAYLNQGSHLYRTLIMHAIRALAKSRMPFSIAFLLNLVETGSIPDYLFNDVTDSIDGWDKRLAKEKGLEASEVADLRSRISLLKDTYKQKGGKNYE
jgi:hypothetical protein